MIHFLISSLLFVELIVITETLITLKKGIFVKDKSYFSCISSLLLLDIECIDRWSWLSKTCSQAVLFCFKHRHYKEILMQSLLIFLYETINCTLNISQISYQNVTVLNRIMISTSIRSKNQKKCFFDLKFCLQIGLLINRMLWNF
jgi:hypothetical protein